MKEELFCPAPAEHIRRERERARKLRNSRWWKEKIRQGRCHYCGKKFPPEMLTMDHLTPLIHGGITGKNNVAPACKLCNSQKGRKTLIQLRLKKPY